MMSEEIADARNLIPRLIGIIALQLHWNVPARLRDDLNTTFDGTSQLDVAPVGDQVHSLNHFGYGVDIIENIA